MQDRRDIVAGVGRVALVLLACVAAMLVVYALLGALSGKVLLGAALGYLLALGNFCALCVSVSKACDAAVSGSDTARAQLQVQSSRIIRMVVLLVAYGIALKLELCDPVAALLPLVFAQLAIRLVGLAWPDEAQGVKPAGPDAGEGGGSLS